MVLRIATKIVESLKYKLRTFGVNLEVPTEFLCENKSVVKKSSVQASVLNKIYNPICYHIAIEAQSARTLKVGWIPRKYNLAYLFTKTTITGNMRHGMVESILYNKSVVIREKDVI